MLYALQGDNFEAKLAEFKKISTYVDGAYDEDAAFQNLEKHLAEIESKYDNKDPINRFFYVSTPPLALLPLSIALG